MGQLSHSSVFEEYSGYTSASTICVICIAWKHRIVWGKPNFFCVRTKECSVWPFSQRIRMDVLPWNSSRLLGEQQRFCCHYGTAAKIFVAKGTGNLRITHHYSQRTKPWMSNQWCSSCEGFAFYFVPRTAKVHSSSSLLLDLSFTLWMINAWWYFECQLEDPGTCHKIGADDILSIESAGPSRLRRSSVTGEWYL